MDIVKTARKYYTDKKILKNEGIFCETGPFNDLTAYIFCVTSLFLIAYISKCTIYEDHTTVSSPFFRIMNTFSLSLCLPAVKVIFVFIKECLECF